MIVENYMNTETQVSIFFLISSVGFVILWILTAIVLFYLVKITHTFDRILLKAEKDIEEIGDITKEVIEDMQNHPIFRFLFGSKRKKTRKTTREE